MSDMIDAWIGRMVSKDPIAWRRLCFLAAQHARWPAPVADFAAEKAARAKRADEADRQTCTGANAPLKSPSGIRPVAKGTD